jgi:uncharacterized membrane protein
MISKDLLVKYVIASILLFTTNIEVIEQGVRIAATVIGIILSFFLIYQVIVNLRVKRIEARKLKAEQEMAEEKLKELIAKKV